MRITPEQITSLEQNQIFVFGSNEGGRHGAGAAKTAMSMGARFGAAEGLQGHTYAIPTKDRNLKTLPLEDIKKYVDRFIEFAAKVRPQNTFLVTEIGCGLAGLTPEDVAPLFIEALDVKNIWLPQKFWDILL